jgi:predicted  nucleic acid-binding Zn-ribbon protein
VPSTSTLPLWTRLLIRLRVLEERRPGSSGKLLEPVDRDELVEELLAERESLKERLDTTSQALMDVREELERLEGSHAQRDADHQGVLDRLESLSGEAKDLKDSLSTTEDPAAAARAALMGNAAINLRTSRK